MSKIFDLAKIYAAHKEHPQFVILDIDSTLVTTYQRNQAILKAFCKKNSATYPEQTGLLGKAQCQLGDYGYYTSLDRLEKKPSDSSFMNQLQSFWQKNFFSNDFLHADVAAPGAVDFVKKLKSLDIPFLYLTGRYKDFMWDGTLKSLADLGFSISPDILILKEDSKQLDEVYKSNAVTKLKEKYKTHQFWLIDNEPVILHEMIKDHSDINLVWFDSAHSGKKQPPNNIPSINHF